MWVVFVECALIGGKKCANRMPKCALWTVLVCALCISKCVLFPVRNLKMRAFECSPPKNALVVLQPPKA